MDKLVRVFLTTGFHECLDQMRRVGIPVLYISGERFADPVNHHEVVAVLGYAAIPLIRPASVGFQIIPDASSIPTDDKISLRVAAGNVRKSPAAVVL